MSKVDLDACAKLLRDVTGLDPVAQRGMATLDLSTLYRLRVQPHETSGFYLELMDNGGNVYLAQVVSDETASAAIAVSVDHVVKIVKENLARLERMQTRIKNIRDKNAQARQQQCFVILEGLGFKPRANLVGNPLVTLTEDCDLAMFPWDTAYNKVDYDGTGTGFGLEIIWNGGGPYMGETASHASDVRHALRRLLEHAIASLESRRGITPLRSAISQMMALQNTTPQTWGD